MQADNGTSEDSTQVRKAVQYAVLQICNHAEDEEEEDSNRLSTQAISALSELAYLYATTALANDLDCFSSHANRRTITVDDVKLVARKNPGILERLTSVCDNIQNDSATTNNKKKASSSRRRSSRAKSAGKENRSPKKQIPKALQVDIPSSDSDDDPMMDGVMEEAAKKKRPQLSASSPDDESLENEFEAPPKRATKAADLSIDDLEREKQKSASEIFKLLEDSDTESEEGN